jgi:hypothetical protein
MLIKSVMVAGFLAAGLGAAGAQENSLAAAGIQPIEVVGFSDSVPKGMPLFAALPKMAPGAEVEVRDVGMSGLIAFNSSLPMSLDPNADVMTASTVRKK